MLKLVLAIMLMAVAAAGQEDGGKSLLTTDRVLDLYSELTGRTVLRPALLPRVRDSVLSEVSTNAGPPTNAVDAIERELRDSDLEVVRDGAVFVWVLPPGLDRSPVAPILARLKRPPARTNDVPAGDLTPAGEIHFRQASLEQVLHVYAAFRHRTVLRPAVLPPWRVCLRNPTSLTHDELTYALNVVLVLNGVGAVDDGDKFTQVVPLRRLSGIQPRAPLAQPGVKLIDPDQMPSFRPAGVSVEDAAEPTVDRLVAFYAELTGTRALASEEVGRQPIRFDAHTPLTRAEIVYAIETTMALNDLKIAPADRGAVRAERRSVEP